MNQPKLILISTITASLLVLAGCTAQTTTNTNTNTGNSDTNTEVAINTNASVVTDTNETVSNDNTNTADESGEVDLSTEALAEVDTSDWLTYTNEEYGFSFKYPSDWKIKEDADYIGVYDPETYALANKPNTTDVVANLSINLFSNSNDATYVENQDVSKSLADAESKAYITNLNEISPQEYTFIDHNAYFDEDEVVYYFLMKEQIISFTFFDNDSFNIKQNIMQSVILN